MKRLETFQKVSLYRTIKVNVCLMENVHLTKFVESLNSEFKLPSRMTFRNHIIKHFQTKGGNMVNYLKTKPIGDILTTTNLWTSSNNYAVITWDCFVWLLHQIVTSDCYCINILDLCCGSVFRYDSNTLVLHWWPHVRQQRPRSYESHRCQTIYVLGSRPSNVVSSSRSQFQSRKNNVAANDVRLCLGETARRHRHFHPRRSPVHQSFYWRYIRPHQSSPGNWLSTFCMATSWEHPQSPRLGRPTPQCHDGRHVSWASWRWKPRHSFSSPVLEVSSIWHQTTTLC